jgi:hypothetical protein
MWHSYTTKVILSHIIFYKLQYICRMLSSGLWWWLPTFVWNFGNRQQDSSVSRPRKSTINILAIVKISCRWGENMSLNCGHQRAYCSFTRWYMSMGNDGGMMSTDENSWFVHQSALEILLAESTGSTQKERAKRMRESYGRMILTGENRRNRRETCHSVTLSATNFT